MLWCQNPECTSWIFEDRLDNNPTCQKCGEDFDPDAFCAPCGRGAGGGKPKPEDEKFKKAKKLHEEAAAADDAVKARWLEDLWPALAPKPSAPRLCNAAALQKATRQAATHAKRYGEFMDAAFAADRAAAKAREDAIQALAAQRAAEKEELEIKAAMAKEVDAIDAEGLEADTEVATLQKAMLDLQKELAKQQDALRELLAKKREEPPSKKPRQQDSEQSEQPMDEGMVAATDGVGPAGGSGDADNAEQKQHAALRKRVEADLAERHAAEGKEKLAKLPAPTGATNRG